jgi:hypothetical protein
MIEQDYTTRSSSEYVDGWLGLKVGDQLWHGMWTHDQVAAVAAAIHGAVGPASSAAAAAAESSTATSATAARPSPQATASTPLPTSSPGTQLPVQPPQLPAMSPPSALPFKRPADAPSPSQKRACCPLLPPRRLQLLCTQHRPSSTPVTIVRGKRSRRVLPRTTMLWQPPHLRLRLSACTTRTRRVTVWRWLTCCKTPGSRALETSPLSMMLLLRT